MARRSYRTRRVSIGLALVALFSVAAVACAPQAALAQRPHKKSFVQRHPNLTSIGAGYAAYKAAKITGKRRK
ncbi:MAG TPA: hypothetical protein VGS41_09105, partial [Chthonomonadales bacterium]|nr:hypothetical protein [Chthonomonadales bacterium]